jgi:hypothetical protein
MAGRSKTSTSSSTPTLDPSMSGLQSGAIQQLMHRMLNPSEGMSTLKDGAMDGVNRNYQGAGNRVEEMLAKRGYGNSGKLGSALTGIEMSRIGDLNQVDTKFAGMQMDREAQTMQLIQQMLSSGRGINSSQTGPNNMMAGAFAGANEGIGDLASMMIMQKMLRGFGGGAGGFQI